MLEDFFFETERKYKPLIICFLKNVGNSCVTVKTNAEKKRVNQKEVTDL